MNFCFIIFYMRARYHYLVMYWDIIRLMMFHNSLRRAGRFGCESYGAR